MKAAAAYWAGNERAFDHAIFAVMPKVLDNAMQSVLMRYATEHKGRYRADVIHHPVIQLWRCFDMSEQINAVAIEASERAVTAIERLESSVDKFRSATTNDLKAMKAVSDRVQHEVTTMQHAYHAAASMLTTPEFERAITNAERMASALKAIHELSGAKVSLALFVGDEVVMGETQ